MMELNIKQIYVYVEITKKFKNYLFSKIKKFILKFICQ